MRTLVRVIILGALLLTTAAATLADGSDPLPACRPPLKPPACQQPPAATL